MGQITLTPLRPQTMSGKEPLGSIDVIHRHAFHVLNLHTGKVCVFEAYNMVYFANFGDFVT